MILFCLSIIFIPMLFSPGPWYETVFIWVLFAVLLIPECGGRCVLVSNDKVIQRHAYIHRKELNICDIKKCYIRSGLYAEKGIDRSGWLTLRLETEKSFMNINMDFHRKKDLILLCKKIGFPDAIKR